MQNILGQEVNRVATLFLLGLSRAATAYLDARRAWYECYELFESLKEAIVDELDRVLVLLLLQHDDRLGEIVEDFADLIRL